MGYRSEVILAVGPEVMPQFMVTMAKSPEARNMCWGEHDEMIKDYCDIKGAFLFRWDHIKWYDGYPWAEAFNQMVEKIEEKLDDEAYRWICIGENLDDVEIKGYGFDHIYVRRSIEY